MLRKFALSLLMISVVVFSVAADSKKKTKTTTTSTTTSSGQTNTISASEGTTAIAIRGIVEPGEGAAVIGFTSGVVTARDRVTGRTFKFNAPAGSNFAVGDRIAARASSTSQPCCKITAINAADHTVTVSEPAVGRTFMTKFSNLPPDGIRIGQAVDADFKAGSAWISGNTALKGQISNLSAPNGLHP